MDQNSTNDADKRNWRERLGIGGREMPRLSNEFTKAPEPVAEDAAPMRPAQPVAKPAPMAPRMPMKASAAPASGPQQQARPEGGPPQAPDALAEKLRSQRAAAERLAEQRVTAAKQRAENAPSAPAPISAKAPVVAAAPGEKPKFSFADEDTKADFGREPRSLPPSRPPQRPSPQQPQLSPPRPPLGGQPRIPTGAPAQGFQPQYRPQPPRGYSPSAYVPPPPLSQPQRSFNGPMLQPQPGEPRLQTSRVNPDAYRRGPQDDLGYAGAGYESSRALQRTAALRAPAYDDDYGDEIFEDAPAARSQRRASANDYNQAYRENEGAYGGDPRRSSGPWLLLLFMILAAGAAGLGVLYYQTNIKTVATNGSTDTAPVVSAPEQSAKSAPEQPLDGQSNSTGSATSRKQIYDRIIGDNEVLGGQVVPTEEAPIQPEARQGDAEQIPEPAGGFDSFSEGSDALPLPMPPPPGSSNDTQGALSTPAAKNTAALSSPATAANPASTAPGSDIAPVPGETAAAANQQATPPAAPAPATEEIVDEEPAPVVKKPAAKKAKAVAENSNESLGAAPVVLVPPADPVEGDQFASAPIVVDQPVAAQPAPVVKKKKTLLGLFRGTNDDVPAAQAAPAAPEQQVASIPDPAPAPAQVASGGAGYFVQLASFKSQAEASAEFGRLRARHSGIIGTLPSAINPATVGGSTRYRLAVGPVASRDQATRICTSLVAAGERDCLVRKQ